MPKGKLLGGLSPLLPLNLSVFVCAMNLSILWVTFGLVGAFRLDAVETEKRSDWDPGFGKWIDCSDRKPPAEWMTGKTLIFNSRQVTGWSRRYKMWTYDIPESDCEKSFAYYPKYDEFMALTSFDGHCFAAEQSNFPSQRFCKAPEGNVVWNYAAKMVSELYLAKLCDLAKSNKWKGGWGAGNYQEPWPRTLPGVQSIGFEDAFHQCWHGSRSMGDLLPNFTEFAKQYGIMNENMRPLRFDKTVCGCYSCNKC